jgi:hypothetical protein
MELFHKNKHISLEEMQKSLDSIRLALLLLKRRTIPYGCTKDLETLSDISWEISVIASKIADKTESTRN